MSTNEEKHDPYQEWLATRASNEAPAGFADRVMTELPDSQGDVSEMPIPLQAAIWVAACLVLCLRVFTVFAVFLP